LVFGGTGFQPVLWRAFAWPYIFITAAAMQNTWPNLL
jgi:hypothetical protein